MRQRALRSVFGLVGSSPGESILKTLKTYSLSYITVFVIVVLCAIVYPVFIIRFVKGNNPTWSQLVKKENCQRERDCLAHCCS